MQLSCNVGIRLVNIEHKKMYFSKNGNAKYSVEKIIAAQQVTKKVLTYEHIVLIY